MKKLICTSAEYNYRLKVISMFDGNPFYGIEKLDFPPVVNEELEDGTGRKYQYCWEDSAVTGSDTARVLKAELSISTEKK